jgi:serine phosphatase RsbU (regulator of sigma subunit)
MRMGVDDYITKPFDIDQLLSRIDRLLERTHLFQTQLDGRIGSDFSRRLLPKSMPKVPDYQFVYFNEPKEHGGGDLFDWMQPSPGMYFITIGDVMGKGLQAKFYAFSFLSYIRGTLHAMLRSSISPAELMQRVNQILIEDEIMEETFASLLLVRWEPEKHLLTYTNAGHCRPILVTPQGAEIVAHSDIILGLDPNARFTDTTITIGPDSALLTYTDGLIEQKTSNGGMLGEERLSLLAGEVLDCPLPIDTLLERILSISEEKSFSDDILVCWLKRS